MLHTFEEIVLTYQPDQYEAWKGGDKSLVPSFHELHDIVRNQPNYHFGEFFAFDHFHRTEGWRGFRFFVLAAIGDMGHARYSAGGEQIARMIPADKLARLRGARSTDPREFKFAKGEPDLFLYKDTGETLFLEVKKGADSPDDERYQLRCLSQIREILGCRAEIVYVKSSAQRRTPKMYEYYLELTPPPVAKPPLRRRGA